MHLSLNQKKAYEQDGFLVIPEFISEQRCDELMREAESLVDQFDPQERTTIFSTKDQERVSNDYFLNSGDQIRFFFEAKAFTDQGSLRQEKRLSINKIGHALHDLNPVFNQFSRQLAIQEVSQDLGCKDPILMQSMYIFKQPRVGGEVVCHQDSTFLFTEPLSAVGLWFALQDATTTNGCMYALPGGHRYPLKRRFRRDENKGGAVTFEELDLTPWPQEGYVPLDVKKGTLIVLHGLLPHLSGANTSEFSRHAYTLHLIDRNAFYPADNWLRRDPQMPAQGFFKG